VGLAFERATAKKDAMDAPDRGGSPG